MGLGPSFETACTDRAIPGTDTRASPNMRSLLSAASLAAQRRSRKPDRMAAEVIVAPTLRQSCSPALGVPAANAEEAE